MANNLGILSGSTDLNAQINPNAKGLLRKFQQNVELSYKKWKSKYKEIENARKYALGRLNNRSQVITDTQVLQEGNRLIKGNIIHATLQGLLPHIYAKNPEIRIRPDAWVEPSGYEYRNADLFSQTLQIKLNESLKKAELKKVAKQVLRSCMTSKIGIIKVTYQRDYYTDPLVSRQFNDAQDSLAAIKSDVQQLMDNNEYTGEKDQLIEEVENTIAALQPNVEVVQREGLNLGFIRPEDFRMDTS